MTGSVTFVPTVEDHVAAQRLWLVSYLRRPVMAFLLISMALLVLVSCAIAIIEILQNNAPIATAFGDLAIPIGAPLLFMSLQILAWWRIPGSVVRMSKRQLSLLSETTWEWDEGTVVATSQAGSSNIRLANLYRWIDGRASVVLMPQERLLLILPRRVLTENQAADLRGMLQRLAGDRCWPKAFR